MIGLQVRSLKSIKDVHLKKGVGQTLHSYEYNLDTERHPTLFRCNEDRIRVTSGIAVQINIHRITK